MGFSFYPKYTNALETKPIMRNYYKLWRDLP